MSKQPTFEPIAIVGRSCILPGALDPSELWAAVAAGRDLVSRAPDERWELAREIAIGPHAKAPGTPAGQEQSWSDRGGYVRGFEERFDADGFDLPAEEILALDPLFHWVLHCGREALCQVSSSVDTARTGAILGNLSFPTHATNRFAEACWLDQRGLSRPGTEDPVDPRNRFMSGLPAHLLARALGLGGGAFALDAACASSIYALKLACDRLHDRRADTMLAGAVSCADDLFIHIGFCALEALSPSGQSRPFHRQADGLLPAEGAAFVALKRLADAEAAGDEILGVIRGIGLSNDGRGRGFLAPSQSGQQRAMEAAYEVSGLTPADISLVECHATGTPVGDATEIRSLATLYEGLEGVPIGSLKSNLGHLVTTAGLAGLLKVLGAMEAGIRPPTLHANDLNPALDGSPFRILQKAEAWPDDRPRRAAISAFGFGGNNGHLLVEAWHEGTSFSRTGAPGPTDDPVAITALSVLAADGQGIDDFTETYLSGASGLRNRPDGTPAGRAESIRLPLRGLRFPPKDLEQTLPQQILLLAAARQAVDELAELLPSPRTGVWAGMGCDPEIARWGLRWRLAGWAETFGADPAWTAAAKDAAVPGLLAAGVVGTMPNMPANRLNSQFDFGGASASISAEEASGVVALELAARAITAGELDAAVVAAVDLSCEPVHEAAAHALLPASRQIPGDAAVVMVLERLSAARRRGATVLGLIGSEGHSAPAMRFQLDGEETTQGGQPPAHGLGSHSLAHRFGHAHAASGLVHVAAAAISCWQRTRPGHQDSPPQPWLSAHRGAAIDIETFSGQTYSIGVRADHQPPPAPPRTSFPRVAIWRGDDTRDLRARMARSPMGEPSGDSAGPARLALVANTTAELEQKRDLALRWLGTGEPAPRGIHLRESPLEGELAFAFTGAAAAYRGMGRDLLLARPDLLAHLGRRVEDPGDFADWVYGGVDGDPPSVLEQLWGSSFLCQIHAELSQRVLGLQPKATLGYSSGESNALMALGAWRDLDGLRRDTLEGDLFQIQLVGELEAVRQSWGTSEPVDWASFVLGVPVDRARDAVNRHERVHLTLINSPTEVVIGGDSDACRVVARELGATPHPLGYPMAVHCPEVETVADAWLDLHRRRTAKVAGVRFYTAADGGRSYQPTREKAARAILGQAVTTVDFPALVEKAWNDGIRIFVEHGPQGLLCRWITATLRHLGIGDREYLAVGFDRQGADAAGQAADTIARLAAAGVEIDLDAWNASADEPAPADATPSLTFAAHWPAVELPALPAEASPTPSPTRTQLVITDLGETQLMAPAPSLPPVSGDQRHPQPALGVEPVESVPVPAVEPPATSPPKAAPSSRPTVPPQGTFATAQVPPSPAVSSPMAATLAAGPTPHGPMAQALDGLASLQAQVAGAQKQFLDIQTRLHEQFLTLQQETLGQLLSAPWTLAAAPRTPPTAAPISVSEVPAPEAAAPLAEATPSRRAPALVPTPSAVSAPAPGATLPQASPPQAFPPRASRPLPDAGPAVGAAPAVNGRTPAAQLDPVSVTPSPEAGQLAASLPGPKIDRRQLEILASGKISEVFGPLFERQDSYPRQVRMPEPPFLLADRVTGIDAEPGSMGTGTIWTETDITADSWYLHQGRIPGGLMIEAGQADLLLISWLGADFLNRGERVYRLLGCELTYRGELPGPGDTLCYDIHIDGHAKQGDVRLFFFHYDCRVNGELRLQVRHGQAGFFTDEELAHSGGLLWDPAEETAQGEQLEPPPVAAVAPSFSRQQLMAFAEGRAYECFGPGYELAASHTATPSIQGGRMMLLGEISELRLDGGPWGRGYLRAETSITAEDWLFEGHFKNDPCMPGTVMFEGCLQTMAFYLAALGYTLERDGWRFEPIPESTYKMRCRGQVIPTSQHLVYEVFVHEVVAGPVPTLWADLLCTVDGLKAFHAQRVGLRLVPDWPLSVQPALLDQPFPGGTRPVGHPVASVPQTDGSRFAFDLPSLLACAWGRPSAAFGEMYSRFDGPRTVARLPGPPYHFMSRITSISGEMGRFEPGAVIESAYDVPPDEWYFHENGAATMPYAVLIEAGLQPCGWLASFIGSALTTEIDLQFRNLDGTGTVHAEVLPSAGSLTNRTKLVATSSSGGVIIVRFEVEMLQGEQLVFDMQTAFGFFPKAAMASQVGLPPTDEERQRLEAPGNVSIDLTRRPERYCAGSLRLAGPRLLMLDRITAWNPTGGSAGRGYLRAEKDVDPGEWFFKAHFFQDPVQPGSLGLEAMLQLLQVYMLQQDLGAGLDNPRFEPIATGCPLTWKYRGQVVPTNRVISAELEITETGTDERGVYVLANAWLWVDGKRIYSTTNLGMRIVAGETSVQEPVEPAIDVAMAAGEGDEEILDPEKDPWLLDHCPTWTLPALPMMSMVERLAAAAASEHPGLRVVGLEDVRVLRWIPFGGDPVRLVTEVAGQTQRQGADLAVEVHLKVWRSASRPELSRFEAAATGTVLLAAEYPDPTAPLAPLAPSEPEEDPYAAGTLFHGPAFQLLRTLRGASGGASATLDAGGGSVPPGLLNQGLLDAATHAIPHDRLHRWSEEIAQGVAAYPLALPSARFFAPTPLAGEVSCEARYLGQPGSPLTRLQLAVNGRVWAELELEEVLLPKGRLGSAPPEQRRAFLRDRRSFEGLGLSRFTADGETHLTQTEVAASDWLAGTVARAYGSAATDRQHLTREVALRDHVGQRSGCHPSMVQILEDRGSTARAVTQNEPLTLFSLHIDEARGGVTVRDSSPTRLHVEPLRRYWRDFMAFSPRPVEDLYYGLIKRFVRKVVVERPEAMVGLQGRPILYLANHQVMVESLLFSTLASGLWGLPTVTLAKDEHRDSWLGQLIAHCFSFPRITDPEVIAFFERDNIRSLPGIIRQLGARMGAGERSVMVHSEGTRSLSSRHRVEALSGSFIDMAIKNEAVIVPVRFVGGLPAEPLSERIDFPLGYGQQEVWFGAPLTPQELLQLKYRDRRQVVIEAINQLGPAAEDEETTAPDPEFAASVASWREATRASEAHAVLYRTLEAMDETSPEISRLVEGAHQGELRLGREPVDAWLGELARRLFGSRGPRITVS